MAQLTFFHNDGLFPQELLGFYPDFITGADSLLLMERLIAEVPWAQQELRMFGKRILTPRLVAWYGDTEKPIPTPVSGTNPYPGSAN